jgi:hypothetical protein
MIVRLNLVAVEGGDSTGGVDASVEGEATQVAFTARHLRDAPGANQAFLAATDLA